MTIVFKKYDLCHAAILFRGSLLNRDANPLVSVDNMQLKKLAKKIVSAVSGVNLLIEDLRVEPLHQHRVGVQIDWASGSMALIQ